MCLPGSQIREHALLILLVNPYAVCLCLAGLFLMLFETLFTVSATELMLSYCDPSDLGSHAPAGHTDNMTIVGVMKPNIVICKAVGFG